MHDWQTSRKIREAVQRPVFLAGGLSASNVRQAIETVQPFGLDLCSSVREAGQLSVGRLQGFMLAATASGASMS